MDDHLSTDCIVKILLVDDEVNITKALRRLLVHVDGYDIYTADSGKRGLELLAEETDIAVIVSDQRMPEMTGVEFLHEARRVAPDAVRILLTGYADIEASIAAINRGAIFRYLTKPWDDDALLQSIREAAKNYLLVAENNRLNALVLKQKNELHDWNQRLKQRVLDQTSQIRAKGDEIAESHHQLQQSFNSTIEILTGLIEMRDQRAPGHSRNVAELVAVMAKKLNLSEDNQRKIHIAGLLHDIGKIGMSDRVIIESTGDLKGKDLLEYRAHVVRGQAVVEMIPAFSEVGELVRHHHERYDGIGFPDGLKGDAIPLGARLICAADLFEHMLIKFPENEALTEALDALENEWGSILDPSLKDILAEGAEEVYAKLDISSDIVEKKVSPNELEEGMQLRHDLYSGTGVLLLKKGTFFDETSIKAIKRCNMVDPFEREIMVLLK
jgi:response regulator RpfG family c-di-GMP phosphodiesterase